MILGARSEFFLPYTSAQVDPIAQLDSAVLTIAKAARNGAPVKILFGTNAFRALRSNTNVTKRFVVGARNGTVSPTLADISAMLMTNPEVQMSMMVIDNVTTEGLTPDIEFLLDNDIFVFASNDTPNTMDPSFMKTFVPMIGALYVAASGMDAEMFARWQVAEKQIAKRRTALEMLVQLEHVTVELAAQLKRLPGEIGARPLAEVVALREQIQRQANEDRKFDAALHGMKLS